MLKCHTVFYDFMGGHGNSCTLLVINVDGFSDSTASSFSWSKCVHWPVQRPQTLNPTVDDINPALPIIRNIS